MTIYCNIQRIIVCTCKPYVDSFLLVFYGLFVDSPHSNVRRIVCTQVKN